MKINSAELMGCSDIRWASEINMLCMSRLLSQYSHHSSQIQGGCEHFFLFFSFFSIFLWRGLSHIHGAWADVLVQNVRACICVGLKRYHNWLYLKMLLQFYSVFFFFVFCFFIFSSRLCVRERRTCARMCMFMPYQENYLHPEDNYRILHRTILPTTTPTLTLICLVNYFPTTLWYIRELKIIIYFPQEEFLWCWKGLLSVGSKFSKLV